MCFECIKYSRKSIRHENLPIHFLSMHECPDFSLCQTRTCLDLGIDYGSACDIQGR